MDKWHIGNGNWKRKWRYLRLRIQQWTRDLGTKCPKMLITFRGRRNYHWGWLIFLLRKLESTSLHSKGWSLAACESNVYSVLGHEVQRFKQRDNVTFADTLWQVVDITKDLATVSVGLFSLWVYTKNHNWASEFHIKLWWSMHEYQEEGP